MLDGAGYHTTPLTVPEGIRLIAALHAELQPAETLWVDEPIVNKHFETLEELDAVVAARIALEKDRDLIRG